MYLQKSRRFRVCLGQPDKENVEFAVRHAIKPRYDLYEFLEQTSAYHKLLPD
jgi:hypothetical protein